MLSALVPFQITKLTKSFIAHIAFVRFLVRVNTHVVFQSTRVTKTLLAYITLVRFLVRVNTLVVFQMTRCTKTLLAHIALVLLRSLPLHSFLINSRFFFLYLMMIHLEIILLLRNPRAHKHHRFFSLTLQNRPRVHRAFRMWILSSSHSLFLLLLVVVVVVLKRVCK